MIQQADDSVLQESWDCAVAYNSTITPGIQNDPENMVIFKDVHEPIIDRTVWEQIQEKRGKIRKRKTKEGDRNMFYGILVCADCGHNLNFHFNQPAQNEQ